jgi:predicted transcriptional regulator
LRFLRKVQVDGHPKKENSLELEVPEMALKKKHSLTHANITGKRRIKMRIIADILRHAQSWSRKHILYTNGVCPGGVEEVEKLLEAEGHEISQKGKNQIVVDSEKFAGRTMM